MARTFSALKLLSISKFFFLIVPVLGACGRRKGPGGKNSPRQFRLYFSQGFVAFVPLDGWALWPPLAGFGEAVHSMSFESASWPLWRISLVERLTICFTRSFLGRCLATDGRACIRFPFDAVLLTCPFMGGDAGLLECFDSRFVRFLVQFI